MTDTPLYVEAPWSQLTGIPVRKHPLLPDGQVIVTSFNVVPVSGPVVLIGTYSTELTRAARSARLAVRRGLADVLAWLGQPVENEPTGDEIWNAMQRKADR